MFEVTSQTNTHLFFPFHIMNGALEKSSPQIKTAFCMLLYVNRKYGYINVVFWLSGIQSERMRCENSRTGATEVCDITHSSFTPEFLEFSRNSEGYGVPLSHYTPCGELTHFPSLWSIYAHAAGSLCSPTHHKFLLFAHILCQKSPSRPS